MVSRTVNINKTIPQRDLEEILIKAAGDMGLKARTTQEYITGYELGSVKEVKRPDDRVIHLRSILPFAEVRMGCLYRMGFRISTLPFSSGFCVATKREVEKYLEAVSKRVEKYQPQAA